MGNSNNKLKHEEIFSAYDSDNIIKCSYLINDEHCDNSYCNSCCG